MFKTAEQSVSKQWEVIINKLFMKEKPLENIGSQ